MTLDRVSAVRVYDVQPTEVDDVYIGSPTRCACGCAGEYTSDPTKVADVLARIKRASFAGKDVQHYPKYYVDYDSAAPGLLKRAKSIAILRQSKPDSAPLLDAWLTKHGRTDDEVVWVPIVARKSSLTMLLDARTGEVLKALPIYPW
jgi:hypothetical protein